MASLPVFVLLLILFSSPYLKADNEVVTIVSTEMPSYLYQETDEGVFGAYVDLFNEAASSNNISTKFLVWPWNRAFIESQRRDDLLIFPLTRNAEREEKFIWLAKIQEIPLCFNAKGKSIDTFEQAQQLERVVVWKNTSHHAFISKYENINLVLINNLQQASNLFEKSDSVALFTSCTRNDKKIVGMGADIELVKGKPVHYTSEWLAAGLNYKITEKKEQYFETIETLQKNNRLKIIQNGYYEQAKANQ